MTKRSLLLISIILLLIQTALDAWCTHILVNIESVAVEANTLMQWIVSHGALAMYIFKTMFIFSFFILSVRYKKEETALKIILTVLLSHTFLTVYYIVQFAFFGVHHA